MCGIDLPHWVQSFKQDVLEYDHHLKCEHALCSLAQQQAALLTLADQLGGPLPALRLAEQAVQSEAGLQLLLLLLADVCAAAKSGADSRLRSAEPDQPAPSVPCCCTESGVRRIPTPEPGNDTVANSCSTSGCSLRLCSAWSPLRSACACEHGCVCGELPACQDAHPVLPVPTLACAPAGCTACQLPHLICRGGAQLALQSTHQSHCQTAASWQAWVAGWALPGCQPAAHS